MSEPKRPGRPPLTPGDTTAKVMVAVPSREYDRAYMLAKQQRVSVPEIVRRGLARELDANK